MNAQLHLYAVAGYVIRTVDGMRVETITQPLACVAANDAEAEGRGLAYMRENWPMADGWHGYGSRAIVIPDELVRAVADEPEAA